MLCLQLPHAVLSPENGTLHQRALWWPQAPESHVHIGGCQDAALKNIHGFRPLIPLSIGGVHGQHLPYLTGITVRYCRYGINSIHFCYNSPESEIAPKVIGIEGDADQGFESHFPIDGANGERITGIHVFSRQAGEDLEPAVYEESLLLGNIIPAQPVAANPFRQPVVGEEPCSRAILVSARYLEQYSNMDTNVTRFALGIHKSWQKTSHVQRWTAHARKKPETNFGSPQYSYGYRSLRHTGTSTHHC